MGVDERIEQTWSQYNLKRYQLLCHHKIPESYDNYSKLLLGGKLLIDSPALFPGRMYKMNR